jgi:hypothetical protein
MGGSFSSFAACDLPVDGRKPQAFNFFADGCSAAGLLKCFSSAARGLESPEDRHRQVR